MKVSSGLPPRMLSFLFNKIQQPVSCTLARFAKHLEIKGREKRPKQLDQSCIRGRYNKLVKSKPKQKIGPIQVVTSVPNVAHSVVLTTVTTCYVMIGAPCSIFRRWVTPENM